MDDLGLWLPSKSPTPSLSHHHSVESWPGARLGRAGEQGHWGWEQEFFAALFFLEMPWRQGASVSLQNLVSPPLFPKQFLAWTAGTRQTPALRNPFLSACSRALRLHPATGACPGPAVAEQNPLLSKEAGASGGRLDGRPSSLLLGCVAKSDHQKRKGGS